MKEAYSLSFKAPLSRCSGDCRRWILTGWEYCSPKLAATGWTVHDTAIGKTSRIQRQSTARTSNGVDRGRFRDSHANKICLSKVVNLHCAEPPKALVTIRRSAAETRRHLSPPQGAT